MRINQNKDLYVRDDLLIQYWGPMTDLVNNKVSVKKLAKNDRIRMLYCTLPIYYASSASSPFLDLKDRKE